MHNARFREGRLTTGFIAEEYPDGFHGRPLDGALERRFVAAALAAKLIRTGRAGAISGTLNGPHSAAREFVVSIGDAQIDVTDATYAGSAITANIAGAFYGAKIIWQPGDSVMRVTEDNRQFVIQITRKHGGYEITHGGARVLVTVRSRRAAELAALMPAKVAADTSKFLLCPMPGLVVSINVSQGQQVEAGETLAVVEAMKMENVLTAERAGTVKSVNAKKGDSLALDDVILEFA
jgi:propionyl-CoA carboxylase alpha chain